MTINQQENYELKKHTTFKIGGRAKKVFFPATIEEMVSILKENDKAIILGGCSNVLVSSNGVEEDVIITSNISEYQFEDNILKANCGTKGPLLSRECEKKGLSGFEFMIGFPGSIGGMICMNASAHSQAISDSFSKCTVFDLNTKKTLELTKEEMKFDYRKSIFSNNKYILLNAEFELKPCECEKINELMNRNLEFRKQRQPSLTLPNVGSIFKNPDNDSAGRLLDLAGAKELTFGGAKVWESHANFIVNVDNATSKDVLNLMLKMYDIVKEKYTIELQPEIKYIGIKDTEEEKIWQTMIGKNTVKTQK